MTKRNEYWQCASHNNNTNLHNRFRMPVKKKTVWCVDEMNIRSNFFCSATTKNKTHKHAQNFISILLSLLLFSNIS